MPVEVIRHPDLDPRIGRLKLGGKAVDSGNQDAGEEEVRDRQDPPGSQRDAARQPIRKTRPRDADKADLDPRVPLGFISRPNISSRPAFGPPPFGSPPFPEQTGCLVEIAVGVGIAGTPPHHQHRGLLPASRPPGFGLGQPLLRDLEDQWVEPDVAAVDELDAWVARLGLVQLVGKLHLDVAGSREDHREDDHPSGAQRHATIQAFGHQRLGQLDETALDSLRAQVGPGGLTEVEELFVAGLLAAAVTDQKKRIPVHGSTRRGAPPPFRNLPPGCASKAGARTAAKQFNGVLWLMGDRTGI